jgi:hypothetical protein
MNPASGTTRVGPSAVTILQDADFEMEDAIEEDHGIPGMRLC